MGDYQVRVAIDSIELQSAEASGITPLRHKAARSRVFLAEGTAP